jgi:ubiquinone/menaquinone biosynthesis C-methylase UbiE
MRAWTCLVLLLMAVAAPNLSGQRPTHGRLFPPEDLGILESPDREEWQQPDSIMDALGISDGSRVADVGAGGGWFTIRLARRVGPGGTVYAEDIQRQMIESIQRRIAEDERLSKNVVTVLGAADDPRLPARLNAVLIVDAYPQFQDPVTVLKHVARALAPSGWLGIVDFKKDGAGGPGPPLDQRVDSSAVKLEAARAGLILLEEISLRYQYLLVFGIDRKEPKAN